MRKWFRRTYRLWHVFWWCYKEQKVRNAAWAKVVELKNLESRRKVAQMDNVIRLGG